MLTNLLRIHNGLSLVICIHLYLYYNIVNILQYYTCRVLPMIVTSSFHDILQKNQNQLLNNYFIVLFSNIIRLS